MVTINPYLTFNGNCEEAFNFYKSVFGGEFKGIFRYKDMPPSEDQKISQGSEDKIMHVSLPIKDDNILMGSDSTPHYGDITFGQNISLSIDVESKEEADRIFGMLSQGGNVAMPMADTFWDAYFGMLTDKFQINWMVSYNKPK